MRNYVMYCFIDCCNVNIMCHFLYIFASDLNILLMSLYNCIISTHGQYNIYMYTYINILLTTN